MTPPIPPPTPDDYRRADLLVEGGNFAPELRELFARGIAVARTGGDVKAFLRAELPR